MRFRETYRVLELTNMPYSSHGLAFTASGSFKAYRSLQVCYDPGGATVRLITFTIYLLTWSYLNPSRAKEDQKYP